MEFQQEMYMLSQLSHPSLLPIFGFMTQHDGRLYQVFDDLNYYSAIFLNMSNAPINCSKICSKTTLCDFVLFRAE